MIKTYNLLDPREFRDLKTNDWEALSRKTCNFLRPAIKFDWKWTNWQWTKDVYNLISESKYEGLSKVVCTPNLSAILENWCYICVRRHTPFTCERLFAISLENISPESFYENEFFFFKIPKCEIPECKFYILYAILKSGMVAANCRLFTNKYLSGSGKGDLQVGALKFFPLPLLMPKRLKKRLCCAGKAVWKEEQKIIRGGGTLNDLCNPGVVSYIKSLHDVDNIVDPLYEVQNQSRNERIHALCNLYFKRMNLNQSIERALE